MCWQANSLSGVDNPSLNLYLDRNENKFILNFDLKGTYVYTYLFGSFLAWKSVSIHFLSPFKIMRDEWEMILENFLLEHLGVKNELNINSY